jgi:hypothetical protein
MPWLPSSGMERTQCETLGPSGLASRPARPGTSAGGRRAGAGPTARAAGCSSAKARVYIFLKELPALLGDILAQFMKLHIAALVRRCCWLRSADSPPGPISQHWR